jgi:hypothetical protein
LKNLYLTFDSHLELLDSFNQPIKWQYFSTVWLNVVL